MKMSPLLAQFETGILGAVLGPPKTGKSTFLASVAELIDPSQVLLLATKPREANSIGYREAKIASQVYMDSEWMPDIDMRRATAYQRLLKDIYKLQKDDSYKVVLLDVFNDAAKFAANQLLAKDASAKKPGDLANSRAFYGDLFPMQTRLLDALMALTVTGNNKHVLVACHIQAASDEEARDPAFEGRVLPMLPGKIRGYFAGEFDFCLYSGVDIERRRGETTREFYVQVLPDAERHAGVSIVRMTDPKLPNSLKAVLDAATIV